MKIALIGYKKMGETIEQIAIQRRHQIVSIMDINSAGDMYSEAFKSTNVAIEFATPATTFDNYVKCFEIGVPVVSSTAGWLDCIDEIEERCERGGKTFFYAFNLNIGINIFFAMNKYLTRIINNFPSYDIKMTEVHYVHELDVPSGTAITLAKGILENIDRKGRWTLENVENTADLPVRTIREGEVPGIHKITYESDVDMISIRHDAKSRAGFALGVIIAAEFTAGKKGFLGMNNLFKF